MTNLTRFSSASRGVYQGLSSKFRQEWNTVNQNTEKPFHSRCTDCIGHSVLHGMTLACNTLLWYSIEYPTSLR